VTAWKRVVALGILCLTAALPALAQRAVAIRGTDDVLVQAPPGMVIHPYSNIGYHLTRADDGWHIQVNATPLASRAAFRLPAASAPGDEIESLARRLTASESTVYGAASRVLDWVARNIEYQLDRTSPQDAETVLRRRTGYCTGIARLTVRLLSAVGIESREVPGYVVASTVAAHGIVGYHRWVEIHYPDRGWAFSDPIASHHYVPATYLRLASEQLDPLWAGSEVRLTRRRRDLTPVDVYPSAAGITARRNRDVQLAAALLVEAPAWVQDAQVVLSGSRLRQVCELTDRRCIFVGLPAGSFEITMNVGGESHYNGRVKVNERQRVRLRLPDARLGGGGEAVP
jgi:hypothetical protein